MGSIIKVDHLSYVYNPGMPNAVTALDDVSFEVEEGDFVGIIGATGSGKSTLITHMNGLNKPTSGHIIIDGRDLWAEPEKIREFRFHPKVLRYSLPIHSFHFRILLRYLMFSQALLDRKHR